MNTLLLLALLSSGWLYLGWLGWRANIYWWTQTSNMTRGDRRGLRWLIIFGPINLLAMGVLIIEDTHEKRLSDLDETIYFRKRN